MGRFGVVGQRQAQLEIRDGVPAPGLQLELLQQRLSSVRLHQRFDFRWKSGKRQPGRSELRVGRGILLSRGSVKRDRWRPPNRCDARTRLGNVRYGRLES